METYWTPKRIQVVDLIAQGVRYQETAKQAGISLTTVDRWVKDPEFRKRLRGLVDPEGYIDKEVRVSFWARLFGRLAKEIEKKIVEDRVAEVVDDELIKEAREIEKILSKEVALTERPKKRSNVTIGQLIQIKNLQIDKEKLEKGEINQADALKIIDATVEMEKELDAKNSE